MSDEGERQRVAPRRGFDAEEFERLTGERAPSAEERAESRRANAHKLAALRQQLLAGGPPSVLLADHPEVRRALAGVADLDQRAWLSRPQPLLGGRTPVEALRDGDTDDVLAEARALPRHRSAYDPPDVA